MNKSKQQWIEKGYEHFAIYGPDNLSINKLSKELGSPRASFYHHFGDIEVFIQSLLDMHWQIILEYCSIGAKECKKLFPDLYILIAQFPLSMKFNLQLFLNRNNPTYNFVYIKTYNVSSEAFTLKLFCNHFNLSCQNEDVSNLWATMIEAWNSRIDTNNLSAAHLQEEAEKVVDSVMKFISSDLYSKIKKG